MGNAAPGDRHWLACAYEPAKAQVLFALVQIARKTGDRYRDISDEARARIVGHLQSQQAPAHYVQLVAEGGTLEEEEQKLSFGESLPRGLRLE